MKRYTRYFKHCMAVDNNGTKHYQEGIYVKNGGEKKLFDLENLEEELGFDLITALNSAIVTRKEHGADMIIMDDDLVIVDDPTNKQNIEGLKVIPKRRRNMFVIHTRCREVNGVLEVLEAWSETIGGDDE